MEDLSACGSGEGIDGKEEEYVASTPQSSASLCSSHHRRSKSASDRNLDFGRKGVPEFWGKDVNGSQGLINIMKSGATQGLEHHVSNVNTSDAATNHRTSLENDIKQLQMHLHQEKTVRIMLERAIGRASNSLSPGHRHFTAQTRELIAEIELLEEEVVNREQHVLSLYRSIFDQCVSGTASEQSSEMASPAHIKNGTKRHPSIISSAFCSSRKFPLQPFQVLASIKESGKKNLLQQPKKRHVSQVRGNNTINAWSSCSDTMKCHEKEVEVGNGYLARPLKEHIYQCPSKLSEELLRSMAAIYCWVRSEASSKPEKTRSPILSRSSTGIIRPRQGTADDQDWSCRSTVEISQLSINKNRILSVSYAISNYRLEIGNEMNDMLSFFFYFKSVRDFLDYYVDDRALVEQLEKVDASLLESDAKMAFWINVYNSLVMHAYLAYGIPHSSLRKMALFHKAAYNVGGHVINADTIEHSIFCLHTPRSGRWLEAILSSAMRKKSGEEKKLIGSRFGFLKSQPLVCFALCTGSSSDPSLKVYTYKYVKEELEKAVKEFLIANVFVKNSKVFLPKLLERYAREASISFDDLLAWVSENVDKKLQESIQKCVYSKSKKKPSQMIEWSSYNTRFRYVFGRELTEKPWWV